MKVAIPKGSEGSLDGPNGSESMNGLLLFSGVFWASLGGKAGGGASTGVTWAMGTTGATGVTGHAQELHDHPQSLRRKL